MLIEKTEIPPRGWNSFDCYMGGITEEQALANLEIFLKKLKPHRYEYFCLDAGWYADGDQKLHEQRIAAGQFRTLNLDEFGRYIPSPVNFPHGLRTLADRCHENGIKFGLHMMRGPSAQSSATHRSKIRRIMRVTFTIRTAHAPGANTGLPQKPITRGHSLFTKAKSNISRNSWKSTSSNSTMLWNTRTMRHCSAKRSHRFRARFF